jgi:UDP-N-acetylglucosamine 2-epimerase
MPTTGRPRLLSIVGTRPEIIQAAPVSAALAGRVDEVLVHTGQHYDPEMSDLQIADLRLPEPAHNLGVGSLPDLEQLDLATRRLCALIAEIRPDGVMVRGDTNTTLAGARAALCNRVVLLHVEAGVRSRRPGAPEERNRPQADRLSRVLFAPNESARATLLREGVRGAVHVTGDPLVDVLLATRDRLPAPGRTEPYLLATVHRDDNTDDPDRLRAVLSCLGTVPRPVVLPLHPRTRGRMAAAGIEAPPNVHLRRPVSYSAMLALERDATGIATDSGCVQREAYLWGVPCITLREETEWMETVQTGWNALVGADPVAFRAAFERPRPAARPPVLGSGGAAERIARLTADHLGGGVIGTAAPLPRPAVAYAA